MIDCLMWFKHTDGSSHGVMGSEELTDRPEEDSVDEIVR